MSRCHSDFSLFRILLVLLIAFVLGRLGIVCYNTHLGSCWLSDYLLACGQGFVQDVATALLMVAPLAALTLVACLFPRLPLRWMAAPYALFMGLLVGAVTVFDAVMYRYWQFKLGAVMLAYAASPEGATNSVSTLYVVTVVGSAVVSSLVMGIVFIRLMPKRVEHPKSNAWMAAIALCLALLSALFVDGGTAYREDKTLFQNNVATNPVYNYVTSFHVGKPVAERYHTLPSETCDSLVEASYPLMSDEVTDTLLRTDRPNILVVLMESFGGKFVEELGGVPGVAPNLSRLIPQGIFWENYYSNSFRTDRGTVALYSGTLPHPDVCLMKDTLYHASLPSLPRTLQQAGYTTTYFVGETVTNMGKGVYLSHMGFDVLDHTSMSPEELQGSWGAYDDVSAQRAVRMIAQKDSAERYLLAYQTISSHEPWDVPYHRLEDHVLNAFAYSDQAVGNMVDSLRLLPQWDNLLIIILPDHGFLYEQTYETPEFFHSPMLWLGGAIRQPRRMQQLMNQSDVAATLLSQMRLPHGEYRWSRNVLSPDYTHPFVYCNYPAGLMLRDSTGVSIHSLPADKSILEQPADNGQRTQRAKAILQASYDNLKDLNKAE